MTDSVIPQWDIPSLPVAGGGSFPVRRIYCVGRNYAAHAREMGHDPDREPPFFFTKAPDAVFTGPELAYPTATEDVHPECEMIVALAMPITSSSMTCVIDVSTTSGAAPG